MSKYLILLLILITTLMACKQKLNPNGLYHVYKIVNGKRSDTVADNALKENFLKKPFLIIFTRGAVSISCSAIPRPKVLHRMNGENGIVIYTPGGYDPLYQDTSIVRMELHTSSSDTLLFINDRSFMSSKNASSGKMGGMIICHLSKTSGQ